MMTALKVFQQIATVGATMSIATVVRVRKSHLTIFSSPFTAKP